MDKISTVQTSILTVPTQKKKQYNSQHIVYSFFCVNFETENCDYKNYIMNLQRLFISLFVVWVGIQCAFAQTFVPFATLDGNGTTMNTSGWTLNNCSVGETPGDPDADANELILVPGTSNTSASIQYNAPLDVGTTCNYWLADFDIGMSQASGAGDGIALIVSSAPITINNASGGYLGIAAPGAFTGFSVCMDGYDNCPPSPAPELEIRYNTTDECIAGPSVTTPTLYANTYQNVKVAYKNGLIEVYFNGAAVPNLTGNYNLVGQVYFTFTSANGGGTGFFSLKNANIYIVQTEADAGADHTACEGSTVQIGATAVNDYTYQWSPATDLDNSMLSNPIYTAPSGLAGTDTLEYIVTATIGTCSITDTTLIVASPFPLAPTIVDDKDTICQGNTTSFVVSSPTNANIAWYDAPVGGAVVGGGSVFNTPPVSVTTTYYAESILGGACASLSRTPVTVTIMPAPAAPTALASPVCEGQDGVFQATAPAGVNFVWYNQAAGGLSVHTGSVLTINSLIQDTTLYVQSVDANGCTSLTRTGVTLQVDAIPSPPNLIADTTCIGEPASLSANVAPGTFITWYSNNLSATPLATGIPFITPNLTQNIYFYAEASTAIGCKSTRIPVQVIVYPHPDNPIVLADTICPGTQANLSITSQVPGNSYSWYANAASTTPIFTGTSITTPYTNISLTYFVQSEFFGCTSLDKVPVTAYVDEIPTTPIAQDVSVCPGSDAELKVISPSIAEANFFWYNPGTNLVVHQGSTYNFTNVTEPATFYIKSVSKYAGCVNEDADVVSLILKDVPVANFTITPDTAEIDQWVSFVSTTVNSNSGSNAGIKTHWDFGAGNYANVPEPEFKYFQEGLYPITLYVTNEGGKGCSDSITKTIFIKNLRELYIPTAFSPNHDGFNDLLPFFGSSNIRNLTINIYSRWGKSVYTTNNLGDTWNGLDKRTGEVCPEGVYTVVADYSINGVKRAYKGTLTIVR